MADSNRSPAELERDIEGTRSRISGLIDELTDRVQPSNMIDRAVGMARDSGAAEYAGDFATNLARAAKDNPVPVALIGVALGWLALDRGGVRGRDVQRLYTAATGGPRRGTPLPRSTTAAGGTLISGGDFHAYRYDDTPDRTGSRAMAKDPTIGEKVSDAASAARDAVTDVASTVGSSVASAYSAAKGAAANAASSVLGSDERGAQANDRPGQGQSSYGTSGATRQTGGSSSSLVDRVSDVADSTGKAASYAARVTREGAGYGATRVYESGRNAGRRAYRAGDAIADTVREQPILLGILGIAAGAVIAAALPRTRREDEILGVYRDELRDRVTNEVSDRYEDLREEAGARLGDIKEDVTQRFAELRDEASTRLGDLRQEAVSAYGEVKDRVSEGYADVKEGARSKLDEAAATADEAARVAAERAKSSVQDAAGKASGMVQSAAQQVAETADRASGAVKDAANKVSETADKASGTVKDAANKTSDAAAKAAPPAGSGPMGGGSTQPGGTGVASTTPYNAGASAGATGTPGSSSAKPAMSASPATKDKPTTPGSGKI